MAGDDKQPRQRLVYEVVRLDNQGKSQRAIHRKLGIARDTVKRILEQEKARRARGESAIERVLGPPRAPRASKLDTYAEDIDAWLTLYEDLTAVRLHEMLAQKGFDGGYTIVRERLKKLKVARAPKAEAFAVVSTPPGHQGQFDWSPYKLEGELEVQLWSCTLSWSRGRSFRAEDNTRQTTVLNCLKQSFEDFGGVPHQGVTDSMPGVVDRWECNRPILNLRFVDFAAYYHLAMDIAPRRCGRYKGKVERPFWYAEINLLNGRRFHSVEEFREVLAWWTRERAMKRPHPETKRPIEEMLAEERPYLQPLPARPYDTRDVVIRQVDSQGYVRHATNLYRVPDEHVGELVYLCVDVERIEVFDGGVHRIAEHERLADGGGLRARGEYERARRGRYDVELLTSRFTAWSPVAEEFARRLRKAKRYAGPQLSYILGLHATWSADDIVRALEHALEYEAYNARAIERILETRFRPRTLAEQIASSTSARIKDVMRDHPVVQRSLTSYQTLRTGDPPLAGRDQEQSDEQEQEQDEQEQDEQEQDEQEQDEQEQEQEQEQDGQPDAGGEKPGTPKAAI
jgi:transposase